MTDSRDARGRGAATFGRDGAPPAPDDRALGSAPAPGRPAGREREAHAADDAHHALPGPTIWPLALAGGVTLLAAGVATNVFVSLAGLVLMALSLRGWVHDLRSEGMPADGDADEAGGLYRPAATAVPGDSAPRPDPRKEAHRG